MNLPEKITICEVGLRDGLQNEKTLLDTHQKIHLLEMFQKAGIKIIEIGSFVNPKAVPQMQDIEDVFKGASQRDDVEYRALILNEKGIERAEKCGIRKVKFAISASRTHQMKNANKAPEYIFEELKEIARFAAQKKIELSGAIATAFGCPFEGKISTQKVKDIVQHFAASGISEISLSDTTGMANPRQVFHTCVEMRMEFPEILWNLHFHNTRGMGLANVLAGMQAEVTRYDASLGGLGGCPFAPGATGNIATEDLLHMCEEMRIETAIDLDQVIIAAKFLEESIGHELPSSILKAGKNSDLHSIC